MSFDGTIISDFDFEAKIIRRLNAFLLLIEEGVDSAIVMYPEDADFLFENNNKTYQQVKAMLYRQLERV